MNRHQRFSTKTITIDNSLNTKEDGSAPILLYDGLREVYYKTTIKHILMVALKESREFQDKMEERMNEFERTIKEQQTKFISDSVKTNEAIINLVRANTK